MAVVDDLLDDSERAELQHKARPCAIKLRLHEARGLNCDRDEAVLCSSHGGGLFYQSLVLCRMASTSKFLFTIMCGCRRGVLAHQATLHLG